MLATNRHSYSRVACARCNNVGQIRYRNFTWATDGFHRLMAHVRIGAEWVTADVRTGSRREALLHSVGANHDHGLQRTNADKRHAVTLVLEDPEWGEWSNHEIARRCAVSEHLVRSLRPSRSEDSAPAKTYTTKHGTGPG